MTQNDRNDDAAKQIVGIFLLFLGLLVFGLFLLSQWLTRLLLRHVLNPLLDGLLDRHDGAVILISSVLWALVAGGILFPLSVTQGWYSGGSNIVQAWLWHFVFGSLWGVMVGTWVLGAWWAEALDTVPVGHAVVQLLGTPIEIRHPGTPQLDTPSPSGDDGWLEQLIMGEPE